MPASVLTDNGCIYTAKHRGGKVVMETLLETLGVTYKHSRPYHPQTCGKVERFHQTLKKFLAKQPPPTLAELQTHLDRFVDLLQPQRPHRALGRRTPQTSSTPNSKPTRPTRSRHALPSPPRQSRQHGSSPSATTASLHHIGMGARPNDQPVVMLIADRDIRIITPDGELLRHLTLDPTRDYQPQTLGWISTMT